MRFLIPVFLLIFSLFANQKQYVIGVQDFPEYLPYSKFSDGDYQGFNRELLDAFAKHEGVTFKYEAVPVKRLIQMFLLGKVDFKYPDNEYWSADLKKDTPIIYSHPVVHYIDGVIVLNRNKGRGIEKLKVLGTIRGFTPFTYLEDIKTGKITLHENSNYMGLLRMIYKNRVDGTYTNVSVSKYYFENDIIEENDKSALVFDPGLPHTKSTRHLSTIKHPKLLQKFNQWMEEEKPFLNSLKKKYLVEEGI